MIAPQWPSSTEELIAEQQRLARQSPPPWRPSGVPLVAGLYVCFGRGVTGRGEAGERGWAGAALCRGERMLHIEVVAGVAAAPYEPGLLAQREGPLLSAAVAALPERPDVLMVNATGRDHPRGAGLAIHLGAVLELPSVGVTDRPLVASGEPPARERSAVSALTIGDDIVGHWLRSRAGTRPIAVHAGWRTDPDGALEIVRVCLRRARTPEPLRRARRAGRLARAGRLPVSSSSDQRL